MYFFKKKLEINLKKRLNFKEADTEDLIKGRFFLPVCKGLSPALSLKSVYDFRS